MQKKRLLRAKKFIIVMFSKKKQFINKTFIFIYYRLFSQNMNKIQLFREIKRLKRFILRDFHYTHQDFIVASEKNFEFDFDYNLNFF